MKTRVGPRGDRGADRHHRPRLGRYPSIGLTSLFALSLCLGREMGRPADELGLLHRRKEGAVRSRIDLLRPDLAVFVVG